MDMTEAGGNLMLFNLFFFCIFFLFSLCFLAFWIWMLVDCLKYESSEGNDKLVWTLVIILANWIGALIYFFVRRTERKRAEASP